MELAAREFASQSSGQRIKLNRELMTKLALALSQQQQQQQQQAPSSGGPGVDIVVRRGGGNYFGRPRRADKFSSVAEQKEEDRGGEEGQQDDESTIDRETGYCDSGAQVFLDSATTRAVNNRIKLTAKRADDNTAKTTLTAAPKTTKPIDKLAVGGGSASQSAILSQKCHSLRRPSSLSRAKQALRRKLASRPGGADSWRGFRRGSYLLATSKASLVTCCCQSGIACSSKVNRIISIRNHNLPTRKHQRGTNKRKQLYIESRRRDKRETSTVIEKLAIQQRQHHQAKTAPPQRGKKIIQQARVVVGAGEVVVVEGSKPSRRKLLAHLGPQCTQLQCQRLDYNEADLDASHSFDKVASLVCGQKRSHCGCGARQTDESDWPDDKFPIPSTHQSEGEDVRGESEHRLEHKPELQLEHEQSQPDDDAKPAAVAAETAQETIGLTEVESTTATADRVARGAANHRHCREMFPLPMNKAPTSIVAASPPSPSLDASNGRETAGRLNARPRVAEGPRRPARTALTLSCDIFFEKHAAAKTSTLPLRPLPERRRAELTASCEAGTICGQNNSGRIKIASPSVVVNHKQTKTKPPAKTAGRRLPSTTKKPTTKTEMMSTTLRPKWANQSPMGAAGSIASGSSGVGGGCHRLSWLTRPIVSSVFLLLLLLLTAPTRPPSSRWAGAGYLVASAAEQSTGAQGDELSRAVLATMSTQSSFMSNPSTVTAPTTIALASGAPNLTGGGSASTLPLQLALQRQDQADLAAATTSGSALDNFEDQYNGAASAAAETPSTEMEPLAGNINLMATGNAITGSNGGNASTGGGTTATTNEPNYAQPPAGTSTGSTIWDQLLDFARIFIMGAIIVGDICGNSLVILSVCRHSKLRVTTNWFVVSLACADILVALFAMTFNASVIISGRWLFKSWVCDFWNSCDVLASTASILHLCCISIDRYIAIMRPLDYPMKITTRRVVYALCGVWISSALLSYIPIFTGIYTTAEHIKWLEENPDQCEFVVNRVYAIVSSSISFWIPCCIMVFTYYRIYREATRQEKFIYKAQSMMPAPMINHHHNNHANKSGTSKQRRSKSMAVSSSSSASNEARIKQLANKQQHQQQELNLSKPALQLTSAAASGQVATTKLTGESQPLASSVVDVNNNNNNTLAVTVAPPKPPATGANYQSPNQAANDDDDEEQNSDSGQSTPTKRSISKMKREHKAAKTLGIIMGVFILCWLPFFSWYTPMHICGHGCDGIVPRGAVTLLFWIGYFNSTLNPIIYAYFNHEFRDAFKKTLQWIFCCCNDLKCLRVNRPNDNQRYNCTYRSTQEIGLVNNS